VDIGVQIHPQHGSAEATLEAWRRADERGFSSVWTWDHVSPLKPGARAASLEAWTLLAAAAMITRRARIGVLVSCVTLRAPELVADMARTVNEISGGRLVLGVGAGWREEDCAAYQLAFPGVQQRLTLLGAGVERIRRRLVDCEADGIPIMIGGGRSALLHASRYSAWNFIGPAAEFAALSGELEAACVAAGRNTGAVARSVLLRPSDEPDAASYVRAGASELILGWPAPFEFESLERRRDQARAGVAVPASVSAPRTEV
jgi:alkanesulfonate monooxygenase SsuD/methylene tetrahydromethanopterin reductase-like flavin-dependent oxidoreductase (luciferase family)